ncbi:MAG: hypothetical protein R3174_11820, partial [Gammaproteobacteria bacterium]|nr:hypothetical protein [Gammaproteobacteria bacterium]
MAPVVNRRSSWLRAPALDALVLVAGLLLPAPELRALEALTFEAGPAAGHDWSVDRLTSRLRFLPDGGLSMDIDASGVRLPEPLD